MLTKMLKSKSYSKAEKKYFFFSLRKIPIGVLNPSEYMGGMNLNIKLHLWYNGCKVAFFSISAVIFMVKVQDFDLWSHNFVMANFRPVSKIKRSKNKILSNT